jgi:hypothetical protein
VRAPDVETDWWRSEMRIEFEFFTPAQGRMMRLPYDARMLLHLGGVQRCAPLLVRSARTSPERAAAVPTVEAAFSFAWANIPTGDAATALALAEQLHRLEPQDIWDEVNEGDGSYAICVMGFARYLEAVAAPADPSFFLTSFDTPAQLYGTWFIWSEHRHGRTADRDSRAYRACF